MTGGPVVLDLRALDNPEHRTRGIGRWVADYAAALAAGHGGLVGDAGGDARIYHVLSPFELAVPAGELWPSWAAEGGLRLVVTLFDLIPLLFPGRYLTDVGQRRRYHARLELVRAADAVLAISETTRQDAISLLGLPPSRVVSVGTGVSPVFRPPPSREAGVVAALAAVPELRPPFVLCVGGEDDRKNIEGVLRGYALAPPAVRAGFQLVVTCAMTPGYRSRLAALAGDLGVGEHVLLTGFVADEVLVALYQAASLLVFASLYEGFGLPVAEAMACGTPAIASGTSALAEVADPAGWFDPLDPAAIGAAIHRGLLDPATRAALQAAADRPAPSWAGVADRSAEVYRRLLIPRP